MHLAVIHGRPDFIPEIITHAPGIINKKSKSKTHCQLYYDPDSESDSDIPTSRSSKVLQMSEATPLHYACIKQDIDVARRLIKAGAHCKVEDSMGRTPEAMIYEDIEGENQFKADFIRLIEEV